MKSRYGKLRLKIKPNKVNSECLLIALQQEKKNPPLDLPHVHYMVRTLAVTAMNRVRKRKSIGGYESHLMELLDLFSGEFLFVT